MTDETDNTAATVDSQPNFGSELSLKDLTVLVPAAGSALALAWEVGSFLPIGGSAFGMFTITEHLVFALQAMPVALSLALMFFATYLQISPSRSRQRSRLELLALGIGALTSTVFGIYLAAGAEMFSRDRIPWFTLLTLFLGVMLLTIWWIARGWLLPRVVKYASVGAIIGLLSFAVGVDQTRILLRTGAPSKIETTDEPLTAVIVRSSSTGAVLYDRSSNEFRYFRSDQVKQRAWKPRESFIAPKSSD
jgi:hypothetical protein